jgi:hypothetical protein
MPEANERRTDLLTGVLHAVQTSGEASEETAALAGAAAHRFTALELPSQPVALWEVLAGGVAAAEGTGARWARSCPESPDRPVATGGARGLRSLPRPR